MCDRVWACRGDPVYAIERLVLTEQTCPEMMAKSLWRSGRFLDAELEAGTLELSESAVDECLSAVRDCSAPIGASNWACREAFEGEVALGSPCTYHEMCQGEAYCASNDAVNECPGTCTSRKEAGEPCLDGVECAPGLTCTYDATTGDSVCQQMTIHPPAEEGAECGETGGNAWTGCADGLFCDADEVCRAFLPAGAPCSSTDTCVEGMVCVPKDEGSVCAEAIVQNAVGDSCDDVTRACNPIYNLRCVSGSCEAIGDGSIGSPCSAGQVRFLTCAGDSYCSSATQTCEASRPDGESCSRGSECSSGVCSDAGDGSYTCQSELCSTL